MEASDIDLDCLVCCCVVDAEKVAVIRQPYYLR
jgi:hypothetical protein